MKSLLKLMSVIGGTLVSLLVVGCGNTPKDANGASPVENAPAVDESVQQNAAIKPAELPAHEDSEPTTIYGPPEMLLGDPAKPDDADKNAMIPPSNEPPAPIYGMPMPQELEKTDNADKPKDADRPENDQAKDSEADEEMEQLIEANKPDSDRYNVKYGPYNAMYGPPSRREWSREVENIFDTNH